MIVLVGGQARKVGKTRAVCDIIAATREAQWTAVKISPHAHDAGAPGGDTQRYLDAGAAAAFLISTPGELPPAANLIIESNAAAAAIRPDLFVFVKDEQQPEWKHSATLALGNADIIVDQQITDEVLRRVRQGLSESRPSAPPGSAPHPPE